ncbi:MAG: hypothetical protein RIF32_04925 [Leptospirales bacterium]
MTGGWREVRDVPAFRDLYAGMALMLAISRRVRRSGAAFYRGLFLDNSLLEECRVWLKAGEDHVFHMIAYQRFGVDNVHVGRERLLDVVGDAESEGEPPPEGIYSLRSLFDSAQEIRVTEVTDLPIAVLTLMRDGAPKLDNNLS